VKSRNQPKSRLAVVCVVDLKAIEIREEKKRAYNMKRCMLRSPSSWNSMNRSNSSGTDFAQLCDEWNGI